MSITLPEPHHQSAANFNAPDEPFYTADQMHAHAAAVSAAKDAEIAALRAEVAGLRAELLKSLADNAALRADAIDRQNNVVAPLRARVRVLEDARPEPDCRTCAKRSALHIRTVCALPRKQPCANGDRYEPLPPVRLWRTA